MLAPMRGQHIPNRIADYNAVFDFGTESIGRHKKQVGFNIEVEEESGFNAGHGGCSRPFRQILVRFLPERLKRFRCDLPILIAGHNQDPHGRVSRSNIGVRR